MEELSPCRSRQDLLRAAVILAPELTRFLTRKGARGVTDAQDLMQEVYIRILKIRTLHGIEQPKAYLYKVAASVAYEQLLRSASYPMHVVLDDERADEFATTAPGFESNAPESHALLSERLDSLAARLSELPPRVRDAVLWHHRDGYTCDEIADKLCAATHRVKKYLVRGLAHCRDTAQPIEAA
jgi:RNA polymerase sigma factor (sigma-70 family)